MARGAARTSRKAGAAARPAEAGPATDGGLTPLDYMLTMLRDESLEPKARFEIAKAAAPYVHAKLATVEPSGGIALSHEDALAELDDESEDDEPRGDGPQGNEPEGEGDPPEAAG
ncbi:hypothetical protein [Bosea psychrotolerans]|uniref:Uncharacterized protein n=1 Tax=Bosea psychrotolerans TaxID=1871628 RepID=A0A2S4MCN6_9HYPH|nr:hypothetical protein [Bosea psychrotolerans]POR52405.1 hypothetical protein CYD53_10570 [Bosea psychrotolerans]